MNKSAFSQFAAGLMLLAACSVQAAEQASNEELTRFLELRLGTNQYSPPVATEVDGVYMTRFGNRFAYLMEGGRYVFIGELVDLEEARNITESSRRQLIVDELAAFGESKRVIFPAIDEQRAVLNVFTDTSCGYCQQLHREVEFLQQAGIAVHYYPYPRGGIRGPGYHKMKQVWCAEDQQAAMSIAKGAVEGNLDASESCDSAIAVDEGYLLGNRIGVNGTPSMFTSDGAKFNGYVPYQELIPQLLNNQ